MSPNDNHQCSYDITLPLRQLHGEYNRQRLRKGALFTSRNCSLPTAYETITKSGAAGASDTLFEEKITSWSTDNVIVASTDETSALCVFHH